MRPDTSEYLAELRTLPGKRRKFLELFYIFCPLWLFSSCSHYRGVRSFRIVQPVMDTESPEGGRRRGLVVEFCRDLRFGFAIHPDSHRISESAQVSGSPSKSKIAPIG